MNQLNIELEDLVFKTINPNEYRNIDKKVKATKRQREKYISKFITPIKNELQASKIDIIIFGRAKLFIRGSVMSFFIIKTFKLII